MCRTSHTGVLNVIGLRQGGGCGIVHQGSHPGAELWVLLRFFLILEEELRVPVSR